MNQIIYSKLEQRFQQGDPWDFAHSSYDQKRFEKMLHLVKTITDQRILEIGCARGDFTKMLSKVSSHITAIDASPTAVAYAKKRVPKVTFQSVIWENFVIQKPYDLVILADTLFYMPDMKSAIEKVARSGKYLLTSTFLGRKFRPWQSEYLLSRNKRFKRIHSIIHFSLKERKACRISLWEIVKK